MSACMPDPPVPAVDLLGVHPVELPHAGRKIAFGRFNDQMVVIGHLAPGVDRPVVALADLRQDVEPDLPVGIVQINIFPPITARRDMVQTTGEFQSERTRHA